MADGGSSNGEVVDQMNRLFIGENVDNVSSVGIENPVEDSSQDANASDRETRAVSVPVAPISRELKKYTIGKENRGVAIIFNHTTYMARNPNDNVNCYTLDDRTGSNEAKNKLEATFRNLGFQVHVCNNFSSDKIMQQITPGRPGTFDEDMIKLTPEDLEGHHCIVVAVLTHGSRLGYLEAEEGGYHVTRLYRQLSNCDKLKGKPKLFFIQASIVKRKYGGGRTQENAMDSCGLFQPINCAVASDADFLISFEGQYDYSNEKEGSPCTSVLCQLLDDYHTDMDLVTLLTIVNREVGQRFSDKSSHCFNSSLTKRLYL